MFASLCKRGINSNIDMVIDNYFCAPLLLLLSLTMLLREIAETIRSREEQQLQGKFIP